mgnify:CR=1 FL=1
MNPPPQARVPHALEAVVLAEAVAEDVTTNTEGDADVAYRYVSVRGKRDGRRRYVSVGDL